MRTLIVIPAHNEGVKLEETAHRLNVFLGKIVLRDYQKEAMNYSHDKFYFRGPQSPRR